MGQGLELPELFKAADDAGISDPATIPTIPEMDEWMYNTTRWGQPVEGMSMVCDVFICAVYKAAGLFGSDAEQIQCSEQTNWDVYSIALFDKNFSLPSQCTSVD